MHELFWCIEVGTIFTLECNPTFQYKKVNDYQAQALPYPNLIEFAQNEHVVVIKRPGKEH